MYDCLKEESPCESSINLSFWFFCLLLFALELLPQSKKIQKRRRNISSQSTSPSIHSFEEKEEVRICKTYCIFDNEEKKQVLFLIKKFMMETLHVYSDHQEIKASQWVNWFESILPEDFEIFLKRYIPFFVKFK